MPTVQQFINSTLRLIGVIDSGETPSSTESDDALQALNQLLASWSSGAAPVYQLTRSTVALTGLSQYALTTRPVKIRSMTVIAAGGERQDVQPATAEQWGAIPDQTRAGRFATLYLNDNAFPLPTVRLWPIPATGGTLEIWALMPLVQFVSLGEMITLPPGYEQALRFAFASVLAPEYGATLSPEIAQNAAEAKGAIARLNAAILGPSIAVPTT